MKNLVIIYIAFLLAFTIACDSLNEEKTSDESDKHFNELLQSLNQQFSETANYQSILISYDQALGDYIRVKVTSDSIKSLLEEWFYINGKWDKMSESKLKLENKQPEDVLFSLKEDYDLSKLVDLVDNSKEKVKKDMKVKQVVCKSVNLLMSNTRDAKNKMDNLITQVEVEPEEGGTIYNLSYDATGNFRDMTY